MDKVQKPINSEYNLYLSGGHSVLTDRILPPSPDSRIPSVAQDADKHRLANSPRSLHINAISTEADIPNFTAAISSFPWLGTP
jgi:hypothetical protein